VKKSVLFPIFLLVLFLLGTPTAPLRATEVFGGVGVLLDFDPRDPQTVLIYTVTYKSPADKAKIRRGERLLKIDGTDVTGMTLQQMSQKIRGPVGTQVVLSVAGSEGSRDVPLTRESIQSGPIVAMPPPNVVASGVFFTDAEKQVIKQKILGLTTDEQREKMLNLLKALKAKQITKTQFMGFIKSDF